MVDEVPPGALLAIEFVGPAAIALVRRFAKGYHVEQHEASEGTSLKQAFYRGCPVCEARKLLAVNGLGYKEYEVLK